MPKEALFFYQTNKPLKIISIFPLSKIPLKPQKEIQKSNKSFFPLSIKMIFFQPLKPKPILSKMALKETLIKAL
jgi:hypothetical protein